jgi:WD40 repeat protein
MYARSFFLLLLLGFNINLSAQFTFNVKQTTGEIFHKIFSAHYSSHGKYIVTTGSDNNIIIWSSETGIIYRTLAGLKKRPNAALFLEETEFVLSGGEDNNITLWDVVTGNIIASFEGHKAAVKTLDVSPDGKFLASGSDDGTIRIWDISSKNLIFELKGHKMDVNSLQFSPDGKKLASGSADYSIIIWNLATGSILAAKKVHNGWIRDVAFSPDGSLIASAGDDKLIRLSKVTDLTIISTFPGHKDWVQTIDFSPNGKYLISGGHDHLIILWEIASGKILYQSEKQGQIVLSVDFCPARPDFISAGLLSENLETWAISGVEEEQWKNLQGLNTIPIVAYNMEAGNQQKINQQTAEYKTSPDQELLLNNTTIELFSPLPVLGRIVHDKNNITLIGRVSDPEGVNTFLINRNIVKLSEVGVFQFNLNLSKGENFVELTAINTKGKMSLQKIFIDCTASDADSPGEKIPEILKSKYFALIIGINDYQDSEITDLDNPLKDAESLYNVLLTKYTFDKENMVLLKNPTQGEIIITLDGLGRKLTNQDNLLIFFAGHGYWDEKGKVGYWLPSDASKSNTVNWFRNSTLRDFIGSIQTKHTILIADACFSGAIFKTRAAFTDTPLGIQKLYDLPSRKAMTSGILQEVPDESVFLKYLVKTLDENKERYLSSEVLFSSFKNIVMNNSPNVPQYGIIQNVGDEGGDFVFIKRD